MRPSENHPSNPGKTDSGFPIGEKLRLGSLLLLPIMAHAQTATFEEKVKKAKDDAIGNIIKLYRDDIAGGRTHVQAAARAVVLNRSSQYVGRYLEIVQADSADRYRFLFEFQEARSDLQVGSSSGSKSATTSIVTKGTVPTVLGFAVEHGALERDVVGSSVTFRGSPVGLLQTFSGLGFQESHDQIQGDRGLQGLSRLSFALTFDTSAGSNPGVLLASKQQVSAWSVRYQIVNHRDPRDGRYKRLWDQFLDKEGADLGISGQRLFKVLTEDPQIGTWNTQLVERVSASTSAAEFERLARQGFAELEEIIVSEEVDMALTQYMNDIENVLKKRSDIRDIAMKGSIATIEYSVSRDPNLPDLSDVRFIGATSAAGRVELTFNAGMSFFNKNVPSITNRVKAYEVSGQLDVPLSTAQVGSMTLSAAWRFQKLPQDTTLPGFTGTVKKGVINTGQLKLTIPVKGSGVKIPFSFTTANRSELISEKRFLSANVGVTFDFDSILAKLTP